MSFLDNDGLAHTKSGIAVANLMRRNDLMQTGEIDTQIKILFNPKKIPISEVNNFFTDIANSEGLEKAAELFVKCVDQPDLLANLMEKRTGKFLNKDGTLSYTQEGISIAAEINASFATTDNPISFETISFVVQKSLNPTASENPTFEPLNSGLLGLLKANSNTEQVAAGFVSELITKHDLATHLMVTEEYKDKYRYRETQIQIGPNTLANETNPLSRAIDRGI